MLDFTLNGHVLPFWPFGSFTKLSVLYYLGPGGRPRGPKALFYPFSMKSGFWSKIVDSAFGMANSLYFWMAASVTVIATLIFFSSGGTEGTECEAKIVTFTSGIPHILRWPLFHMSEKSFFYTFTSLV